MENLKILRFHASGFLVCLKVIFWNFVPVARSVDAYQFPGPMPEASEVQDATWCAAGLKQFRHKIN